MKSLDDWMDYLALLAKDAKKHTIKSKFKENKQLSKIVLKKDWNSTKQALGEISGEEH